MVIWQVCSRGCGRSGAVVTRVRGEVPVRRLDRVPTAATVRGGFTISREVCVCCVNLREISVL